MVDTTFLQNYDGPEIRIMEVCGTHTAAIFKSGIRSLLSPKIRLVSGPGCPVCVTLPAFIDRCIEISLLPGHELICFGDLLKVPGTERTLSDAMGTGGRVRMAWSPFDALTLARNEPETVFVFAAIGFETTAPAFGLLLEEADKLGVRNLKLITSLKSALAAIDRICAMGEAIDAFLCPGHVSVITGAEAYAPLAEKYKKPMIVAGFEGERLLAAVCAAAEDATGGRYGVRNLYPEAVSAEGNKKAQAVIDRHFITGDADWRGLGTIPQSGYCLKATNMEWPEPPLARAATAVAGVAGATIIGTETTIEAKAGGVTTGVHVPGTRTAGVVMTKAASATEYNGCRCGDVILGRIDPNGCPLFGTACTPSRAVGPCMVSSEGACGFWYRSRK